MAGTFWFRLLPLLLATLAQAAPALPPLQPLIDAAVPGSIVRLQPGIYAGPVQISKPLTLDGGGKAEIRGSNRGTVVTLSGQDVTLRGLHITGSGELHDSIDAGIQLEGRNHVVANNRIDNVLFGIHLRQASASRILDNQVTGKDLTLGMRGDAIRIWNGTDNRIEGNRFQRGRDLTLINAPDNLFIGNQFTDGRYGMHLVFSPRTRIERNHLSRLGTGIIILYSPNVLLRGNHIEHALEGGGAGIVFKDSDTGLVEGNTVLHCAVGLKVDAPPEPIGVLEVRNNRFAHNVLGMYFYGEAGGHRFTGNRFEKNLTTVAISGLGTGSANVWQGNHWDDYAGFDRDQDGIGDTPHEIWLYADRIWMETPMATFFRNAPGFELLDFLERLAPFAAPHRVLQDPAPRILR